MKQLQTLPQRKDCDFQMDYNSSSWFRSLDYMLYNSFPAALPWSNPHSDYSCLDSCSVRRVRWYYCYCHPWWHCYSCCSVCGSRVMEEQSPQFLACHTEYDSQSQWCPCPWSDSRGALDSGCVPSRPVHLFLEVALCHWEMGGSVMVVEAVVD